MIRHGFHLRGICLIAATCMFILLVGCARQNLNLATIQQGIATEQSNLKHFKESGYTVYVLFDLVPVHEADVNKIVAKANPEGKPVTNITVTSEADFLAALLNLLNGGTASRGVIVSLNKVTVEGDILE